MGKGFCNPFPVKCVNPLEVALNIDNLLKQVEKPARYTGGELNITTKTDASLRFALCFPDVYEVGMSHLGSRILYNIINKSPDMICERAYCPWPDMESTLRSNGIKLFSLENKRPLDEFDIVGFSLLYEMCYTNILTMLDLAGIERRASRRGEDAPLVICGGPCVCNAEPIADFFDAVLIGDGEEMILDVSYAVLEAKRLNKSKRELLETLSKIDGVYIPSFYEPEYDSNGGFTKLSAKSNAAPEKVQRRVVKDLEHAEYLGKLVVPYMSIVHDRVALEVFRGCTRGCRFCQAGYIYRPVRERTKETVMKYAHELIACTGYDEISLFSLSTGDYSAIHELVPEIIDEFTKQKISIALPSLRIDSFLKNDLEKMQQTRKTGLTFAPEAGTQRLRDVINKCVTEDDLLNTVRDAFESGWNGVKLYFMIGLPTETEEDILGIAELARKVSKVFYSMPKEQRGKGLRLNVSASSFVPKPFTPFQWEPQDTVEQLKEKQHLLREALRGIRGVEFSYHAPYVSELEGVFARGDRRLAAVVEKAYENGARFDSWDEYFSLEAWNKAFEACGLNKDMFAHRRRDIAQALPWDHLDMLVKKEYLENEYKKALCGDTTKDCRKGCNGCFGENYANYCKI